MIPYQKITGMKLALAVAAITLHSCFRIPVMSPPSRLGTKKVGSQELIVDGSVTIERSEDRTSALLKFDASTDINCSISFFLTAEPQSDYSTLTWVPCKGPLPARNFTETVSPLKPEVDSYTFLLKAWPANGLETAAVVRSIVESSSPQKNSNFFVMRLDLVRKQAQIATHKISTTLDDWIKPHLDATGCRLLAQGSADFPNFGDRQDDNSLMRASSKGLFTGLSESNATDLSSLLLTGSTIQWNTKNWLITTQMKSSSGTLRLNIPAQLKSASLASGESSTNMSVDELMDSDPPRLSIPSQNPLKLSWSTTGTTTQSVVHFIASSDHSPSGIYCSYPVAAGTGDVDANLLAKLDSGLYWGTLYLDTFELRPKDQWVIRSSDWRTVPITKL